MIFYLFANHKIWTVFLLRGRLNSTVEDFGQYKNDLKIFNTSKSHTQKSRSSDYTGSLIRLSFI